MENSLPPCEKVKTFPTSPGVYIMKDGKGVVLYIGKAKNLRNRASHYFTKAAAEAYGMPMEKIIILIRENRLDQVAVGGELISDRG